MTHRSRRVEFVKRVSTSNLSPFTRYWTSNFFVSVGFPQIWTGEFFLNSPGVSDGVPPRGLKVWTKSNTRLRRKSDPKFRPMDRDSQNREDWNGVDPCKRTPPHSAWSESWGRDGERWGWRMITIVWPWWHVSDNRKITVHVSDNMM